MNWYYPLNDPRDRWFAEDKIGHFFGGAWVWAIAWAHSWSPWVLTLGAILGIEVLELGRWVALSGLQRLRLEDGKPPWPVLTDRLSPKDMVVGFLGALLSWGILR